MKTSLPSFALAAALSLGAAASLSFAADANRPAPASGSTAAPAAQPDAQGVVRVYGGAVGAGGWTRVGGGPTTSAAVSNLSNSRVFSARAVDIEKETVPFLGVETGPVGATLAAQLGLTSGAGLVVSHILPDSPAAAALKLHDILLKLDEQILIEQRQLAVLIRQRKSGDEVTLTYLRGGKEATAKVKLSQHEVPKVSLSAAGSIPEVLLSRAGVASPNFEYVTVPGSPIPDRKQVDGMLSLLQTRQGQPFTVRIDRGGEAAGVRRTAIDRDNSSLVYRDDDGALELTAKDGVKTLVAKNAQGEQLFSGPVTTDAERKAMPEAVRTRLEKLEGMQDVTFRTDGDFERAETKVVRPLGRGVSFPRAVVPAQPSATPFF